MKSKFFYNTSDIQKLKSLIRTGKSLIDIAREEHENFNTTERGLYSKLQKVAKHTRKVRTWKKVQDVKLPVEELGVVVPDGISLDMQSKRVVLYNNHVRIYF